MLERIRAFLKARPAQLSRADSFWLRMDEFASTLEPTIQAQFTQLLTALQTALSVAELTRLIANNDLAGVVRAAEALLLQFHATLRDTLRDAVTQSGNWTLSEQVAPLLPEAANPTFAVRFDVLNPAVANFLRGYEMPLITQITDDVRQAVRAVVTDGVRQGTAPATMARRLRPLIGLTEQQTMSITRYQAELENGSKGALRRTLRDARSDRTVQAAVDGVRPLSEEKIATLVERYRARTLAFRAETIARTESLRALNTGAHLGWLQAEQQGLISTSNLERTWIIGRDERTCPICRQIPPLNPTPIGFGDLFATPQGPRLYPPMHPRCRCTVWTAPRIG